MKHCVRTSSIIRKIRACPRLEIALMSQSLQHSGITRILFPGKKDGFLGKLEQLHKRIRSAGTNSPAERIRIHAYLFRGHFSFSTTTLPLSRYPELLINMMVFANVLVQLHTDSQRYYLFIGLLCRLLV